MRQRPSKLMYAVAAGHVCLAVAAVCLLVSRESATALSAKLPSDLPDPRLTPGATFPDVTLAQLQAPNYSKGVRNVPQSEHLAVARRYGITVAELKRCEVDHLVPLSWGGSNEITNLWPQPYTGRKWNARVKDRLEVHGLAMIRSGQLDLKEAQRDIAKDWQAFYVRIFGAEPKEHLSMPHEQ